MVFPLLLLHSLPLSALLPKVLNTDGQVFAHLLNVFFRLAEMKGATATDYGLIIGTNCLVAFIVTPFVGNHLDFIGVKFAFITGIFGGGACCLLSGFLEYFQPGTTFLLMSILVR